MAEVSIDKFKKIFSGLDIAYGTYLIKGARHDGKQNGKAAVIHRPPTDELWVKHLRGVEPSLGIIPIRADSTCSWGAIDIDMYPIDHAALVKKIRKLELPLIVFRSKSGGAHCYMFSKDPIQAADMQKHLKLFAAYLGHSGCEIFPKQTELLIDRGDRGNFLNLPYFGGDNGTRYAFKDNGEAASLEEFYELYERLAVTAETEIKAPAEQVGTELVDGPPCLQVLCSQGFPEGTRNNGLFNLGVFLRKAHPDTWEDAIMRYNQSYMNPPLPLNELTLIVRQLKKKDYGYKCKDAPINGHCNAAVCKTRKYGIGNSSADLPTISSLSKYNAEPPLWFLDVDGRRLELTTEELQQQHKFQLVCMNKVNIMPPTLKKFEWEGLLNGLLKQMIETEAITEAPEDTSEEGRFLDLLEEFCTHLQTAMDREEILMGRPWTNEEEGLTYFRLKDLESFLLRNKFIMSTVKIAQRLRNIQGNPHAINIKNRTVRTWRIPAFAKQNEPFNTDLAMKGSPF